MNITNVGNHGGIERGGDRPQRAQHKRDGAGVLPVRDEAQISESSRATANAVEGFAEKARNDDGDRSDVVAAALARLQSGELDSDKTYRETAKRLLDSKFTSA
ncbi:MAG: hypothetical protein H6838_03735 [Planctomycetes bacterium]|nr:hypothetical protein [Planctomycetota bacterium]MCB9884576.1 hypothetical protein [Planctomycetota bacterium]